MVTTGGAETGQRNGSKKVAHGGTEARRGRRGSDDPEWAARWTSRSEKVTVQSEPESEPAKVSLSGPRGGGGCNCAGGTPNGTGSSRARGWFSTADPECDCPRWAPPIATPLPVSKRGMHQRDVASIVNDADDHERDDQECTDGNEQKQQSGEIEQESRERYSAE